MTLTLIIDDQTVNVTINNAEDLVALRIDLKDALKKVEDTLEEYV